VTAKEPSKGKIYDLNFQEIFSLCNFTEKYRCILEVPEYHAMKAWM
jgi:hypothetical protein